MILFLLPHEPCVAPYGEFRFACTMLVVVVVVVCRTVMYCVCHTVVSDIMCTSHCNVRRMIHRMCQARAGLGEPLRTREDTECSERV